MPELPEVETIVRDLRKFVVGRKIKSVSVNVPKLFRGDFDHICGATIKEIGRKGKIILIRFDNQQTLAIHLKMTGQLIWLDTKDKNKGMIGGHPDKAYSLLPPHKYTHIIIELIDGSTLYFNDLRKFGWMEVLETKDEDRLTKHLGPDPMVGLEFGYLAERYKSRPNASIKTILLDQGIISGIGNIYADESLFCAKINPLRKVGSLSKKDIETLAKCIPEIMQKSIDAGGTSKSDYVKLDGSKGGYLDIAWVYGREGQPCKVCQTPIQRIKIGQRSSHFCHNCQK